MRLRIVLFGLSLLALSLGRIEAATRLAVASGGATTGVCTSTPCTLSHAITQAVAGDTVQLANGTYSGQFSTTRAGTSGSPITIAAANRHQAIISNAFSCTTGTGFSINHNWTVLDGLTITGGRYGVVLASNTSNVTVKYNKITNFGLDGVRIHTGQEAITVEKNAIGHGATCTSTDGTGILLTGFTDQDGVDNSTIKDNIIVALGDNGYQFGSKFGYGIQVANNSHNNTLAGNMLLGIGGKAVMRFLAGSIVTVTGNIVRGNIFLWGEGGVGGSDCRDHDNDFINNISMGNYYGLMMLKGQFDGTTGQYLIRNNLIYLTRFTRFGFFGDHSGTGSTCLGPKVDNTVKNNIFYNEDSSGGVHDAFRLSRSADYDPFCLVCNYNLFWSNASDTTTWSGNYTYGANDIRSFSSPPQFVNAASGDFELIPSTVGTSGHGTAGDDGLPRGITYNTELKKLWMQNAMALPTSEKVAGSVSGTSTSFAGVSPNHYYQVWFHIPDTGHCDAVTTFTVEGTGISRDIGGLTGTINSWIQDNPVGPMRWITLGRHKTTGPSDTTLNISWGTASCANGFFIRQLPTIDEAAQWIADAEGGDTIPPAPPTNLQVTSIWPSQNQLIWTTSGGDTTGYDILSCTGPGCSNYAVVTSVGLVTTYVHGGLTPTTSYSYKLRAFDATGNRSGDSNTATIPTQNAALIHHWEFNAGSGTSAVATVGGQNGTLFEGASPGNGPTWITGHIGSNALNFPGTNDYVEVADHASLDFLADQDFTITMWVRSTQAAAAGDWPMLYNKVASTPVSGIEIGLHDENVDPKWYGQLWIGGTELRVDGCSNIADGNWTHIAFKRQGTSIYTYEDGVPCGAPTTNATINSTLTNAIPLRFGIWADEVDNDFAGDLDDVKIFNHALSDGEIAAMISPDAAFATTHFRLHGIDQPINTEWLAAEDTNRKLRVNGKGRWRFQFENTGASSTQGFPLQCSVNGTAGPFITVPLSCASFGVCIQPDDAVANGASSTRQLTLPGGRTYSQGAFVTDTAWPSVTVGTNQVAELEYRVDTAALTPGTMLCCRPAQGDESAFDSYPTPPGPACVTIHRGSASLYGG